MIIYKDVDWSTPGVKQNRIDNNIEGGKPLAFIIDSEVVLTMATDRWFADFMETIQEFRESTIPENNGNFYIDILGRINMLNTLFQGGSILMESL